MADRLTGAKKFLLLLPPVFSRAARPAPRRVIAALFGILCLLALSASAQHIGTYLPQGIPVFGYAPDYFQGNGLNLTLSQGISFCQPGTPTRYAGGMLAVADNSTNYIFLNTSSSCAPASNTTGYGANIPIAVVVTAGGVVTSFLDDRTPFRSGSSVANGTSALGTSAIAAGSCASVVTTSAPGVATTDNIMADFNADPTSTLGYQPGAMLTIVKYPTANNVNFKACNNTNASITPGAVTLNWRVVR